ncbi:hypothetical protein L227DRAFT_96439 [Lentinus tigrinus ALCF2SS1-6]|uniref:Uncharacterized protein n=1 Tax=Lentinus tigrinus ALCF2SS1-6 TaxID=1328759 RepID=A0A5C2S8N4_9APHY|nr:hypothetical protein L227DRAFT_96439 [Lentinus tigrinus ALCF2SS1-6]
MGGRDVDFQLPQHHLAASRSPCALTAPGLCTALSGTRSTSTASLSSHHASHPSSQHSLLVRRRAWRTLLEASHTLARHVYPPRNEMNGHRRLDVGPPRAKMHAARSRSSSLQVYKIFALHCALWHKHDRPLLAVKDTTQTGGQFGWPIGVAQWCNEYKLYRTPGACHRSSL